MQEAPQAEPPRALRVRPHAAAGGPMLGRARLTSVGAGTPLTHLCAKRFQQLGSWWPGRDAGWAGYVPRCHIPPQAEPARRAAAGRRPDRLGRGPERPLQALRARKKGDAGEKVREEETAGSRRRPTEDSAGAGLAKPAQG